MYVLVSTMEDGDDETVAFEGVFLDKDAATELMPKVLKGVSINNDDGDAVQFDSDKHEIIFEPCEDDIDTPFGEKPTEELEVLIDFGDGADMVGTGYYLLGFAANG